MHALMSSGAPSPLRRVPPRPAGAVPSAKSVKRLGLATRRFRRCLHCRRSGWGSAVTIVTGSAWRPSFVVPFLVTAPMGAVVRHVHRGG